MGENCIGGRNIQFPPNERKNSTIKASTRCSNRSIGRRKVSDCILERVFHPTIVLCVCCQACRGVPRPSPEKGVARRRQREARSKGEKRRTEPTSATAGKRGETPEENNDAVVQSGPTLVAGPPCPRPPRHLLLPDSPRRSQTRPTPYLSSRSRRRKDPFGTYRTHNRKKKGEEEKEATTSRLQLSINFAKVSIVPPRLTGVLLLPASPAFHKRQDGVEGGEG